MLLARLGRDVCTAGAAAKAATVRDRQGGRRGPDGAARKRRRCSRARRPKQVVSGGECFTNAGVRFFGMGSHRPGFCQSGRSREIRRMLAGTRLAPNVTLWSPPQEVIELLFALDGGVRAVAR